ncbi:hypothetical protein TELCIR_13154, partial [Teladorsagia circumcincta]
MITFSKLEGVCRIQNNGNAELGITVYGLALECLAEPDASEKIRQMSFDLGVLHYRMRVWFQAENWLCVKNSLLA